MNGTTDGPVPLGGNEVGGARAEWVVAACCTRIFQFQLQLHLQLQLAICINLDQWQGMSDCSIANMPYSTSLALFPSFSLSYNNKNWNCRLISNLSISPSLSLTLSLNRQALMRLAVQLKCHVSLTRWRQRLCQLQVVSCVGVFGFRFQFKLGCSLAPHPITGSTG